ncbi:MAG TPA: amino acid permease [Bryobacteraceae bacterium]|nr:amino acid permease [Bryobacteraceae bacterium]
MESANNLPRTLGLFDSISIVLGIVIGAGIFILPNLIARAAGSAGWILAIWMVTGAISFFGALAFAELGAMLPATGGQYVYLREAWGTLPAFLCGWTQFLISQSAGIAYLAVSFAIYLSYFIPLSAWQAKAAAVTILALLTMVNYRGVRPSAAVQNACTIAKIAGLAVIAGSAFFVPHVESTRAFGPVSASSLGVAMIACLQAYDGWSAVSFVAGEIKNPAKTMLRALSIGMAAAILIYVLVNWAYLRILTIPEIAGADRVGATAAERTLGHSGAILVSITILLSILGSLNGRLLTQPRVYFAQARDGLFFARFGEVHAVYQTPWLSILMQGAWSAVLIFTGSFETLIDYRIFGVWMLNFFTVAGVIRLRQTHPEWRRPYRMWGYPFTMIAFLIFVAAFMVNTLMERPRPSLTGLAIMAAGVPMYYLWRRRAA